MKRLGFFLVAVLVLGGLSAPAQATQAVAKKFTSCDRLLVEYPNGVARNKQAANRAVRNGFARPRVSASLYKTNSKRLDRNRNGVLCQQRASDRREAANPEAGAPNVAPSPPPVWSVEDSSTWSQSEVDFLRFQTERLKRIARADILWICERLADAAYDDFSRGVYEDRADEGVRLFRIDRSHARQMIAQYWDLWCYSLFYLRTRKV